MAEERIAERIDANLLDVNIKDLENLDRATYEKKVAKIKDKTEGRLIIKEYPTATANVGHIRYLLNELKLKRKFIPDIIYIDYLNIMCSQRLKYGANVNSYLYIKSIAEELRGLAVEKDVPIVTATQTTRSGSVNSDPGLEDTSECIYIDEKIQLKDKSYKTIGEVNPGDQIITNDGYKTVTLVHHKKIKNCFIIKTKSGKCIRISEDHVFPTNRGRLSIKEGLKIGDKLNTI